MWYYYKKVEDNGMIDLICPICGEKFIKEGSSYICSKRHCYDISKAGYVNLLPPSGKGKRHGDDKLMVKARADFLSKGYYDSFSQAICESAVKHAGSSCTVLDAGCGEGKYTLDLLNAFADKNICADIIGTDISKDALAYAAKKSRQIRFAAASSAKLPVENESCDIILNIFSPFIKQEFLRALKPGGTLIRAVPLENHLFELKAAIYDKPYLNDFIPPEEEGFSVEEIIPVKYRINLDNTDDISGLFMMTPYYYKTGREDQEKLKSCSHLSVGLEFEIIVYKKA